jgi:RHS repeat-associated protein
MYSYSPSAFSYLHNDHLGSASVATDGAQTKTQQEYDPWGKVRSGGISQTSINYTGQRLDGTGLLYYHARLYDPNLGRFVSADSIVPGADALAMGAGGTGGGPANPQSLNRYSYVNNNPVKNTDPSGHCIFEPLEAIVCVALAAEAAEVIVTAVAGSALIAGAYEAGGALAGAAPAPRYSTAEMGNPIAPVAASPDGAPAAPDAGPTSSTGDDQLYSRGSFRKPTLTDAESTAPRNEDGEMVCPTCGKVIPDKVTVDTKNGPVERRGYDLDHNPTWAERVQKLRATNPPPTRKQVLDEYNRNVRVQCPECNQGHQYEGQPGRYGGVPK